LFEKLKEGEVLKIFALGQKNIMGERRDGSIRDVEGEPRRADGGSWREEPPRRRKHRQNRLSAMGLIVGDPEV